MISFKDFLELNQTSTLDPMDQMKANNAQKAVMKTVDSSMPMIQSIKPNTSSNDPNKTKAAMFLAKQTISQGSPSQNLDTKKVSSVAKGVVDGLSENLAKNWIARNKTKNINPAVAVSPLKNPFQKK